MIHESVPEFNQDQTEVGSKLLTLKGSSIHRNSALGVGKTIGGKLYFHKDYLHDALNVRNAEVVLKHQHLCPFNFNCIRFDLLNEEFALVESPDFDTDREPVVGRMFLIRADRTTRVTRFYNQIYHHKWCFVKNDYTGFDVRESWEWSKKWLSVLTEPADGSNIENWNAQLKRFNLL